MALGAVAKRLDNRGEHVVPVLHLDGQNGQTHTQLDSDRFGAGGVVLQQKKNLVPESWQLVGGHLRDEVIGDLVSLADP
jgi:hypothetical protein